MYLGVSCSHPLFPVLKEGPPRLLLLARFHLVAHPVGHAIAWATTLPSPRPSRAQWQRHDDRDVDRPTGPNQRWLPPTAAATTGSMLASSLVFLLMDSLFLDTRNFLFDSTTCCRSDL